MGKDSFFGIKNGKRYFLASERTGETDENINYYDK